jgi:hypothetical protein
MSSLNRLDAIKIIYTIVYSVYFVLETVKKFLDYEYIETEQYAVVHGLI